MRHGARGRPRRVGQHAAGAELFAERCSGCHTFDAAGTQGSANEVSDRERVDGPNFNVRKSCYEDALYAIQNGGYAYGARSSRQHLRRGQLLGRRALHADPRPGR